MRLNFEEKFGLERELSYRPPLGPAVLEPGFDLRVRHLQALGQGGPLGARQVLLPVEALLQLADLNSGEGRAGLFPLGRRPVLVRVSYPPGDGERHQSRCGSKERERQGGREMERDAPVRGKKMRFYSHSTKQTNSLPTLYGNSRPYITDICPV